MPTVDIAGTVLVNPSATEVAQRAAAAGIAVTPPTARWFHRSR